MDTEIKEFHKILGRDDVLHGRLVFTQGRKLEKFTLNYTTIIQKSGERQEIEIVRYDCAHGQLHMHRKCRKTTGGRMKKNKGRMVAIKIGTDMDKDLDKLSKPENVDSFPDNVVYFDDFEQLYSVLFAKKLELLKYIPEVTGKTVTEIAIELDRKKQVVSRDLHQLSMIGLVELQKDWSRVYPKTRYDKLAISLSDG
ncbi:MAG TPA: hypothetical protein HA254_00115 [Candidatus Diapherotrites archaeon]|uniref:Uncharacterized protein n=1 Tax=Candidatus Iainarchaeum sp. TaxID=3101447 RepID=A0A7J4IW92_9ARCH|nr:hypothetical protein [Candidatus Diapherotrites archaeon]